MKRFKSLDLTWCFSEFEEKLIFTKRQIKVIRKSKCDFSSEEQKIYNRNEEWRIDENNIQRIDRIWKPKSKTE